MVRLLSFIKLFFAIYIYVECQEWKKISTTVQVVLEKITRDLNEAIVFSNFTTVSLLHCSYVCDRSASASLYYLKHENKCYCNSGIDSVEDNDGPSSLDRFYGEFVGIEIYGYKQFTKWHIKPEKHNCYELYKSGYTTDGVYRIKPEGGVAVDTWCDMQSGGWTTIQHRYDGSENFTRGWSEYKKGFGHVTAEFWLGLDHVHRLTARPTTMLIHMDAPPHTIPAQAHLIYYNVTIGGPSTNYTLNFPDFYASCEDKYSYRFSFQNESKFTTIDSSVKPCVKHFGGGWWFGNSETGCGTICLNGIYGGLGMMYMPCWDVSPTKSAIKLYM